ncbi:DUF3376 domain-containing protein, partial [Candidatus Poribacteria bacterium]|nr:DUF3376 domain-containing protein [Candidatus Poribacteria bacterium]
SHRLPGIPAGTFERFEYLDLHLYPLETLADVGEADPIEVVRVSPLDAKSTGGSPDELLKGTKVFHFSAFMDEAWRVHDIRIGRLNTAEILVKTLLPERDEAKVLLDDLKKEIEGDADAARAADPYNSTLIYALLVRTAGRLGTRVADRLRERGGIARLTMRPIHWFHRITEAIYYPLVILSAVASRKVLRASLAVVILVAGGFVLGALWGDSARDLLRAVRDWVRSAFDPTAG